MCGTSRNKKGSALTLKVGSKDSANPPNLTYLDTGTGTVTILDSDLEESIQSGMKHNLEKIKSV